MADTLIRVFIRSSQGELTKHEYDEKTTKIANEIIKVIEKHDFRLANFVHFDLVDCARPSEKREG